MVAGTLWIGPTVEFTDAAALYVCLGPTYLYGEYRDAQTVENNDAMSWGRLYTGSGFVVPLLLGVPVTAWVQLTCAFHFQ